MQFLPEGAREIPFFSLPHKIPFLLRPVKMQPIRAPGVKVAAGVEVSFPCNSSITEAFDGKRGIEVEEDVVMPSALLGVEEQRRVGECIVMINDVGQVYHCFVTFVLGYS